MIRLWLIAAVAAPIFQNPPLPQNPSGPSVTPGLAPQGGDAVNTASQPAMPPPPTTEQILERLALQVTGLSARIQSLRKTVGSGPAVDAASVPAPESRPSVDTLRTMVGEVSRELQMRAHAIEVKPSAETASRMLRDRTISLAGFKPAPETKAVPGGPGVNGGGPALPAFDKKKAAEVIFNVGATPITRGELEELVGIIRPFVPEATPEQVASMILRRTLIQSAVLRNAFPEQVAAAVMKAKQIHADVAAGKLGFEDAVKQHSEETAVKTFGGLIDGANAGNVSDFEHRAMAKMKPGEISEPFVANATVEILQLLEVKPAATPPQTTYKYRRLVLGVDMGVPASERFSKIAQLVMTTAVTVVNPAYEPFLPPSVQRGATSGTKPSVGVK
jgi:hypothetical protein